MNPSIKTFFVTASWMMAGTSPPNFSEIYFHFILFLFFLHYYIHVSQYPYVFYILTLIPSSLRYFLRSGMRNLAKVEHWLAIAASALPWGERIAEMLHFPAPPEAMIGMLTSSARRARPRLRIPVYTVMRSILVKRISPAPRSATSLAQSNSPVPPFLFRLLHNSASRQNRDVHQWRIRKPVSHNGWQFHR